MIKSIRKLISLGIIASSISILPLTGASAEWKQDSNGWWNTEGSSYSVGWKQIDSKWYYFNNNGYMVTNTEVNGYKIDNNGVWIQNTETNSNNISNSVESTITTNSNNMTNLTNNTDNSVKNDANVTLNNTGVINANTTNNVNVNIEEDNSYQKQLVKIQKDNDKATNAYYQKRLDDSKADLANAKAQLERIKNQKSVQTLVEQKDESFQYQYVVDIKEQQKAQNAVDSAQRNVDYYSKLIK